MLSLMATLCEKLHHWSRDPLMRHSGYSRSQWYVWLKEGATDRKEREPRCVPQATAEAAVKVIMEYPYFSAVKGQAYMIYHRLGYIPHHVYKELKGVTRRIIFQEVEKRSLLPARTSYEHVKPTRVGQIWAEDFTQVCVYRTTFYIAVIMDDCSDYYLGAVSQRRAGKQLVARPLEQAFAENNNQPPSAFMISDNGKQYIDGDHEEHLDALNIVHKRIPACRPQYNGAVECGVKEFKNLFYVLWAARETAGADKEKSLDDRVAGTVEECRMRLNHRIPRPCLKGVTPADLHAGTAEQKRLANQQWLDEEKGRMVEKAIPWTTTIWKMARTIIFQKPMSNLILLTTFCYFLKRPLRKLANLVHNVLGEYSTLSSDFS